MARKRSTPPAGTTTAPTASAPQAQPRTEAEFLAAIPAEPKTAEEFAAAYDGHTRRCVATGACVCNPFADGYERPLSPSERVPWPHWRQDLAHRRWLAA